MTTFFLIILSNLIIVRATSLYTITTTPNTPSVPSFAYITDATSTTPANATYITYASSTTPKTCSSFQFKCTNNEKCIYSSWVCDKFNDCSDKSDELNCIYTTYATPITTTNKVPCGSNEFTCIINKGCIYQSWVCDKYIDCSDGSDEQNCTPYSTPTTIYNTGPCSLSQFKCTDNGKCIPSNWICDTLNDCLDASDEQNCVFTTSTTTYNYAICSSYQFQCIINGECIYSSWVCDKDDDCPDASDENNCTYTTLSTTTTAYTTLSTTTTAQRTNTIKVGQPAVKPQTTKFNTGLCSSWQFQCNVNSECIPIYWKCDLVEDCLDYSDELNCVYTTKTF